MQEIVEEKVEPLENKEAEDALCVLLHCALKDKEYTTQLEQFNAVYEYIQQLEKENKELKLKNERITEKYAKSLMGIALKELLEEWGAAARKTIDNNIRMLKEIKTTSIQKAVIREKIEELKSKRIGAHTGIYAAQIDILEEILKQG